MAFSLFAPSSTAQQLDAILNQKKTSLKHYQLLRADLLALLDAFKSLKPFIQPVSALHKMIGVSGTIPMEYKGHTYNIPVNIWIPDAYPTDPPSVVVTPTADMTVPSNHPFVNAQGSVNYQQLIQWDPSISSSELVIVLSSAFGANPPLRRVAPKQAVPPPSYSHSLSGSVVNPPPSYPKQNPYVQSPPQQPPYSNYPNPYYASITHSQEQDNKYVVSSIPNVPQNSNLQNFSMQNPASPTLVASPLQRPNMPLQKPSEKDSDQELINMLKTSLQNKMQKLKEETIHRISALESEQQGLKEVNAAINQITQEANMTKQNYIREIEQLETERKELESWISMNDVLGDDVQIDFDRSAEPPDVTTRVILSCHAKDAAIEDAQFNLEKALQNNIIDLKQFLKATRDLATEQYYQRALSRKLGFIPSQ